MKPPGDDSLTVLEVVEISGRVVEEEVVANEGEMEAVDVVSAGGHVEVFVEGGHIVTAVVEEEKEDEEEDEVGGHEVTVLVVVVVVSTPNIVEDTTVTAAGMTDDGII